jgi:hypothetical protein
MQPKQPESAALVWRAGGGAWPLQRSLAMPERPRRSTRSPQKSEFADRMTDIATQIERDFQGEERERLLELFHETLERHVEIEENTRRAREALEQLQVDQRTLLQLFEFITAAPDRETLH